jgi:hypothetical protein
MLKLRRTRPHQEDHLNWWQVELKGGDASKSVNIIGAITTEGDTIVIKAKTSSARRVLSDLLKTGSFTVTYPK